MDKRNLGKPYTAILLAAGNGSRMAKITNEPKCLLKIRGESILKRHLRIWKALGIRKVVLVVGYKADNIRLMAQNYEDDLEIQYILNPDYKRLGNTYSLYIALKKVQGPIIFFDADVIYEEEILAKFLIDKGKDQILVGAGELDDIESTKVLLNDHGFVKRVVDKKGVEKQELYNSQFIGEALGIFKFSGEMKKKLEEDASLFLQEEKNLLLNWEYLINIFSMKNNLSAHRSRDRRWIEIDTPEDYEMGKSMFSRL